MITPILFVPGWPNESISEYTFRLSKQTPNNSCAWQGIYATSDHEKAKYAICQDSIASIQTALKLGFRPNQIIYIKREANSALKEIDPKTVLITYQGTNHIIPAVWWIDIPFNDLIELTPPAKPKKVSSIVSACKNLQGHRDRLQFIEHLSSLTPIDIYGRDHKSNSFNGNYKGPLVDPNRCKRKGLMPYWFSVCIENVAENGYITEKFNDALLCFSLPLYFGAANASIYYPKTSFYSIKTLLSHEALLDILEFINEPLNPLVLREMTLAREQLLFRHNIWNIVYRLVKQAES